jgi:hypothetical protein
LFQTIVFDPQIGDYFPLDPPKTMPKELTDIMLSAQTMTKLVSKDPIHTVLNIKTVPSSPDRDSP